MMHFINDDTWTIDDKKCASNDLHVFSTLDKVFLCEGELIVNDKISEVVRYSGVTKKYYIKRYSASGRKLFDFFRKSRIGSESDNLIALNAIGVSVPHVIAYGQIRKKGYFRGALITQEVENTSNLAHHLKNYPSLTSNKVWLHSVIDQLAEHVSNMHGKKFIHRDLNLRNVLVATVNDPAVFLIDCPSGGFSWGLFLRRGIIRDLAHLDKVARYYLSGKELLRFYKKYQQIEKISKVDKQLIYKIRHFHDEHRAKKKRKSKEVVRTI